MGDNNENKGIEKFNGDDFQWWRTQVEDALWKADLYQPLTGTKPEKMSDADWAILDRKALGTVRSCLHKDVGFNVREEKTTAGMMKALAALYEVPTASNKVHLMKKLFNMKMSENTTVLKHSNKFQSVLSQLKSVDIAFDDEINALAFLCSLPESFDNLIDTISNSGKTLTLKGVVSSVMNSETIKGNKTESSNTALVVERGRQNERGRSQARGKSKGRNRSKSRGKGNDAVICWNCREEVHCKNKCPKPQKDKVGNKGGDEGANLVEDEESCDGLCLSASTTEGSDVWFVDSGASLHCTPDRENFNQYIQGDFGYVTVGNGQRCSVVGKGDIALRSAAGGTLELRDVRHVPDLTKNLISVSQLGKDGYTVTIESDQWKETKGAMRVVRGQKVGTMYVFSDVGDHSVSLVSAESKESMLWHQQLGHLSESGMRILHSNEALKDVKKVNLEFCEDCIYGK